MTPQLQAAFLDWLVKRIADLLADEQASPVRAEAATAPRVSGQHARQGARPSWTPRQSNLNARPGTLVATTRGPTGLRALGDTGRSRPPFEPPVEGAGLPPRGHPTSLPPPPMPALSSVCGAFADSDLDALPAMAWRLAPDGLIDGNHARETGGTLEGSVNPGETVNEPSGTAIHEPTVLPCDYETWPRFEHLALRHRPSLRLPYMTGVDEEGMYQREVRLPVKSCRLEVLTDWEKYDNGGGGIVS